MKKATLITIAENTNYSISTVSRVLSGLHEKYRISKKTVDIINEEAKRCNYTPSLLAKGLRTSTTNTIGLIVPSIRNPYFANLAGAIIEQARINSYTVVIVDSEENEDNEAKEIKTLLSRHVDGMIVVPCGQNSAVLEDINTKTPIVLVDRYYDPTTLPYVSADNFRGAYEATSYLIENGHKRIACIQGPSTLLPVVERTKGYQQALKDNGLEEYSHISGEYFTIQNGYIETKLALSLPTPPTAIFTLSNTILLGAIKAIRESKLEIGKDISIISFDDNIFLDYLDPPITRITQPYNELGTLAIKILLQNITQKQNKGLQMFLPTKLNIYKSVKNIIKEE